MGYGRTIFRGRTKFAGNTLTDNVTMVRPGALPLPDCSSDVPLRSQTI